MTVGARCLLLLGTISQGNMMGRGGISRWQTLSRLVLVWDIWLRLNSLTNIVFILPRNLF